MLCMLSEGYSHIPLDEYSYSMCMRDGHLEYLGFCFLSSHPFSVVCVACIVVVEAKRLIATKTV